MITKRLTAIAVATAGAMFIATPGALAFNAYAGTFSDDDGNVHEANIEAIYDANVTDGCNPPDNDEYCPENFVTREQMAKFLQRGGNVDDAGENEDFFDDDEDSIFESSINAIADAGITDGCNPPDNDAYCPEDFVTRGQMAKFLVRTFNLMPQSDTDHFEDDEDSVFEAEINTLADNDVTRGCNPPENDEYCPQDNVTRAEMASFLARAMEIQHEDPTPFGNETCDPAYDPCVPTVDEMELNCDAITDEYPDGVKNDFEDFGDPQDINQDDDDMACEPGDPALTT